MNKKALGSFLLLLGVLVVLTLPLVAAAGGDNLSTIVDTLKTKLEELSGGLSAIAFIVAGVMFLSASANPSHMQIAKGALIAAIVGIVIIILANSACYFVKDLFGVGTCSA